MMGNDVQYLIWAHEVFRYYIISRIMVNEGKCYARTMTTLGVAHFPKNRPPG